MTDDIADRARELDAHRYLNDWLWSSKDRSTYWMPWNNKYEVDAVKMMVGFSKAALQRERDEAGIKAKQWEEAYRRSLDDVRHWRDIADKHLDDAVQADARAAKESGQGEADGLSVYLADLIRHFEDKNKMGILGDGEGQLCRRAKRLAAHKPESAEPGYMTHDQAKAYQRNLELQARAEKGESEARELREALNDALYLFQAFESTYAAGVELMSDAPTEEQIDDIRIRIFDLVISAALAPREGA